MLDGKVLAAVFASLAAIAAAINGGGLDPGEVKSSTISAPGDNSFNDIIPSSLSSLTDFFQNPEPENDIYAALTVADLEESELNLDAKSLEPRNMTVYQLGSREVISDEDVYFYGFRGTIEPGQVTDIQGSSRGLISSGVNISGSMNVNEEVSTDLVRIEGVDRAKINLRNIEGEIDANSTTTTINNPETDLKINSFSGRMLIYPDNESIVLDGKVDRVEAGKLSFG